MARYTGPVCRLCRRAGEKLFIKGARCYTPKCPVVKRAVPPGEHAQHRRRKKLSDRGLQLLEKQKARHMYGVLERQLRRYFAEASKRPGATGEYLLQLLERRLDNVVYRLGFADSRSQARQLVNHGHITVQGHKTRTASYKVRVGEAIAWREESTQTEYYKSLAQSPPAEVLPSWLELNKEKLVGKVIAIPPPQDIQAPFNVSAIVEYYSR